MIVSGSNGGSWWRGFADHLFMIRSKMLYKESRNGELPSITIVEFTGVEIKQ